MEQKAKHRRAYEYAVKTGKYLLITIERGSVHETERFFEDKQERDNEATRYHHLGDGVAKYNPDSDFESQWLKFHVPTTMSQLGIPFAGEATQPTIGEVQTTLQGQMS